jgi:hypothetical protein
LKYEIIADEHAVQEAELMFALVYLVATSCTTAWFLWPLAEFERDRKRASANIPDSDNDKVTDTFGAMKSRAE